MNNLLRQSIAATPLSNRKSGKKVIKSKKALLGVAKVQKMDRQNESITSAISRYYEELYQELLAELTFFYKQFVCVIQENQEKEQNDFIKHRLGAVLDAITEAMPVIKEHFIQNSGLFDKWENRAVQFLWDILRASRHENKSFEILLGRCLNSDMAFIEKMKPLESGL